MNDRSWFAKGLTVVTVARSVMEGIRDEILNEVAILTYTAPCSADAVDEIVTRVIRALREGPGGRAAEGFEHAE